jgi:hypothetical protein
MSTDISYNTAAGGNVPVFVSYVDDKDIHGEVFAV